MLVEIDTDQTMTAVGGEGVGVFIEYAKGGHWHVWWTCDTAQTRQSCDFSVSAAAASGNVSNVDASELAGGFVTTSTPSRVEATSTTTSEVHGIRFDTAPGAIITVDAAVGGLGGCPFAPGATGNIATEDLLYLLDREGVPTGVDLDALIEVASWLAQVSGLSLPGQLHRVPRFPAAGAA